MANAEFGLDKYISNAIVQACSEILNEDFNDQFPLSAFQPGSGIHTTMNINEVIANRAVEIVSGFVGSQIHVDSTRHISMNQNKNNTFSIGKKFFNKIFFVYFFSYEYCNYFGIKPSIISIIRSSSKEIKTKI
jgi:aspartate ammonia-lyase